VHGDTSEPATELARLVEVTDALDGAQEDLVEEVLGIRLGARRL